MAGFTKGRTKSKRTAIEPLDYHEGLSSNQVKIILRELGFSNRLKQFNDFMFGQTCPIINRMDKNGRSVEVGGIYEYDLFRWISSQKTGIEPIWD